MQISGVSFSFKLLMDPLDSNRLIFKAGDNYSLTVDGGSNWQSLEGFSQFSKNKGVLDFVFNPKDAQGLLVSNIIGIYESYDMGESWQLISERFAIPQLPQIHATRQEVFLSVNSRVYKLNQAFKDCLFSWAEQNYMELFSPAHAKSNHFNGYDYRYYSDTNTYLGFFQNNTVHLYEPDKSAEYRQIGLLSDYLGLAGCN